MRRFGVLVVFFLVYGCATYAIVGPHRVDVGAAYSVEPRLEWNKLEKSFVTGPLEIWTSDGQRMDTLFFFTGVDSGAPLFARPGRGGRASERADVPVFNADMSATEIAELFEATLSRLTGSTLSEMTNLRPATFAGAKGFRFDLAYTTRDQLERKGFAVGAVKDKKLYMIFFQGTRIYHYGKHLKEVEHIVASAKFL